MEDGFGHPFSILVFIYSTTQGRGILLCNRWRKEKDQEVEIEKGTKGCVYNFIICVYAFIIIVLLPGKQGIWKAIIISKDGCVGKQQGRRFFIFFSCLW